jgi:phosphoglycolate phosphatase-like HAD superfamily hydrolase
MSPQKYPQSHHLLEDYSCIIWDLDGTLINLPVDWPHLRKLVKEHVPEVRGERVLDMLDDGCTRGLASKIFALTGPIERDSATDTTLLIAHACHYLQCYQSKSAIVTNNGSLVVHRFFELSKIDPTPFIARDMVVRGKPDPEGLLKLEYLWRGKKSVFIGDSDFDEVVARAVGIDFIHVERLNDEA